jgi:hypothetical protein
MPITEIKTMGDIFEVVHDWEKKFFDPGMGFPHIWYRGHADKTWELQPSVLRKWFIDRCNQGELLPPAQVRIAQRERTINTQFRLRACSLLPPEASPVDIYFLAQHYGLPTRLLDWTTNPLTALFFAVNERQDRDGCVYVMNPRDQIPNNADPGKPAYPWDVVQMRHPVVVNTIGALFGEGERLPNPFIVPLMPDLRAGRLLQQNARFTLHMPPVVVQNGPSPTEPVNQIVRSQQYVIPQACKESLQIDLRRAGTDFASVYGDLDNLAREIRTAWRLYP